MAESVEFGGMIVDHRGLNQGAFKFSFHQVAGLQEALVLFGARRPMRPNARCANAWTSNDWARLAAA